MPELPEVESVRRYLEAILIGKKIDSITVYYPKMIQNTDSKTLIDKLQNQIFQKIKRRGKYLIFEFDHYMLLSHLRMEGKYLFHPHREIKKHEHIVFHIGTEDLVYQDTRKFGTFHLYQKPVEINAVPPLNKMGLEPFDDQLNVGYLQRCLQHKKQAIKASLLDQGIVCGLGNIYVDEVLFDARINPQLASNRITEDQLKKLIVSIQKILARAIQLGGTTIRTFAVHHDIHGRFQNELQIHEQKICLICNEPVQKIKIAGRTTYFCKSCQSIDKI